MNLQGIAAALQRVEAVLRRRPDVGVHEDAAASARWQGGGSVVTTHPNGKQLLTDVSKELGGSGEQVTPGWLFRAGFAACAATSIALKAAAHGVDLTTLEVRADSRSDVRGILGMVDAEGIPVTAGPLDIQLTVRIGANAVAAEKLRSLVEDAVRCSPVPSAVRNAVPVSLDVQIDAGGA
jgi:uncharacterized OsmC-like protein